MCVDYSVIFLPVEVCPLIQIIVGNNSCNKVYIFSYVYTSRSQLF